MIEQIIDAQSEPGLVPVRTVSDRVVEERAEIIQTPDTRAQSPLAALIEVGFDQLRRHMAQQDDRDRHQHKHRQRTTDKEQHAGLLRAHQVDDAEKVRYQRGIGEAGQRVEQDGDQRQADIAREQHVDMGPGLPHRQLVDDEHDEQRGAADDQRHDRA